MNLYSLMDRLLLGLRAHRMDYKEDQKKVLFYLVLMGHGKAIKIVISIMTNVITQKRIHQNLITHNGVLVVMVSLSVMDEQDILPLVFELIIVKIKLYGLPLNVVNISNKKFLILIR